MLLKSVTAVLVVVAAAMSAAAMSSPALACKSPTLVFSDDFTTPDSAWFVDNGQFVVASGKAQLTAPANQLGEVHYEGFFADAGDLCVESTAPAVKDLSSVSGGLVFGMTDFSNFYIFLVQGDGQAAIVRRQNNGWLVPVPNKAAPGFKAGGANTLRVTWKNGAGAAYVNDQLVFNFKYQPFTNGKFGLYTEGGNTYSFANIKLTN
jgi:hypothetical protein